MNHHEILTSRKNDHIDLAAQAQVGASSLDRRFNYEPLFATHPKSLNEIAPISFLGKTMSAPLWISSMTGGARDARKVNENLARVCGEFGLGMGLGSCRSLLTGDQDLADFNFRHLIGTEAPFFINLGIAQIEKLLAAKEIEKVGGLVSKLAADGAIIHLNLLQEWFQPEGDLLERPAIETIQEFLEEANYKVIIKEVGQGLGPKSLKALIELPIDAIEFGAFGGTNFSKLELLRDKTLNKSSSYDLSLVGHSADEMVDHVNQILSDIGDRALCRNFIISGGVHSFLDGYYLINRCQSNAVYGQAKAFLDKASGNYDILKGHVKEQLMGLAMAQKTLTIKEELY